MFVVGQTDSAAQRRGITVDIAPKLPHSRQNGLGIGIIAQLKLSAAIGYMGNQSPRARGSLVPGKRSAFSPVAPDAIVRHYLKIRGCDPFVRQRFTVAHEVGHFVLHRDKLERGDLVDDAMYRSGLSSSEETAANRLAADILMPFQLIRSLLSAGIRDPEALANKLQVSAAAMRIRLGFPI